MSYDFSGTKNKICEIERWFEKELSGIHTGRATPSLLDGVAVDSYGAKVAVSHVASITTEDPRTLRIAPWDKTQMKEIEKAIDVADLGVSVSVDDAGLRVFFPELTTERRALFVKVSKEKLEDARVSVRAEREKVWSDIQEKEREGELSEDDKFRLKDELQDIVDKVNKKLEEMAERKEKEIMN
ncbi:MAG: ribosome recycling factor [Patescibacteria group bacterium]|nr:MAG: ribosome recycling factor [Patescibacteria group bacterium]